jgi:HSP20 family protein
MSHKKSNSGKPADDSHTQLPLGGLFDGVANIIGRLGELAEKGEALRREGSFESKSGKDIRGSYGFSVSLGADGKKNATHHEVKPHKSAGVQSRPDDHATVRQPQVDIFEENDHLLVIAEMPGVPAESVSLRFHDRTLFLSGQASRLRFETEVDLPCACNPEDVSVTANNGVVELRLNRTR